MKRRTNLGWMRTVLATLVAGGTMSVWGADKDYSPALAGSGPAERIPEGARFPVCWNYQFTVPKTISAGQEFEVKILITALLFDMREAEFVPAVGGDLELVKGEAWKGALKKGEPHAVAMTLRATAGGFNGPYGVTIKAPGFYDEVQAYVAAQTEGRYATKDAKASILKQLQSMRQERPVCEEWAGGTISTTPEGGAQP